MWFVLIIIVLLLMLWSNRQSQPSVNGYQSQFFNQSNGKSTIIYKQMMDDNVSTNSLREFLSMEDRFLAYEKQAVCNKVTVTANATALSQQIKDRFTGYDFSYHDDHIRQISTPDRIINKKLKCY